MNPTKLTNRRFFEALKSRNVRSGEGDARRKIPLKYFFLLFSLGQTKAIGFKLSNKLAIMAGRLQGDADCPTDHFATLETFFNYIKIADHLKLVKVPVG